VVVNKVNAFSQVHFCDQFTYLSSTKTWICL